MARRRGATARDPKMRAQPVKGGVEQVAGETNDVKGNMTAARRAASRMPTERLSPGVYRSAGGGLVTQKGRPIQRQPQAPMQPAQPAMPQSQPPMEEQFFQPSPSDIGQQFNKPFPMDGLGNFNPGSIGKTPPGYFQGQMQDAMYRVPNLPQMPQASANMGGQYRLSPGVYGTREQAMNQYNQQMQQMYQPVNGLPQGPRGNLGNIDFSQAVPYGQRRG